MRVLTLARERLDLFASVLPAWGELWAPVRRAAGYAFARPARWSEVALDYPRTLLPPKKLVLPPRETLLTVDPAAGYREVAAPAADLVLLGVHPYDVHGLTLLDQVFAAGPHPDPWYRARRRRLTVIGVDFVPDALHFAHALGTDVVDTGFDLFLADLGDDYLCLVGTPRGDEILLRSGCLLRRPGAAAVAEYKRRVAARRAAAPRGVAIGALAAILELEQESPLWAELGARCFGCGACSLVCPVCTCYAVTEEPPRGDGPGARCRAWDSCLFARRAPLAGADGPRRDRAARLRARFDHKQRTFRRRHGRPGCVGCGRCRASCPAGIDAVAVLERLGGAA